MAVRPTHPPRPNPGPRPSSRRTNPGNLRSGVTRNGPGAAGPTPNGGVQVPPRVPPSTPPQPGAPPQPPLNPVLAGLGLLVAAGQALWALLNYRPPAEVVADPPSFEQSIFGGFVGFFRVKASRKDTARVTRNCSTGQTFPGGEQELGTAPYLSRFLTGTAIVTGTLSFTRTQLCTGSGSEPGTPTMAIGYRDASGDVVGLTGGNVGAVSFGQAFAGSNTSQWFGISVIVGDDEIPLVQSNRGTIPEGVGPRVPSPVPATAPQLAPAAAPAPVEPSPVPAEAVPMPAPATVPGGLPGGQPSRPLLPGLRPGGGQAISKVTPGSGSSPITADGVQPQLPPATQPTAPGVTFLSPGVPLVPNGPPPTMQGISTELGKLEQKLELVLAPEGPLSLLERLNKVIDQVENIEFLIDRLFPQGPYTFPAGQYELAPVCDRDSEGALLPPRVAPWAAGEGEITEVRRKLDALAALVQHHKDLKQPTCGGRGTGPTSNVTVHFESP